MTTTTVRRGDTLGALAKKYKTTTTALAKANNIKNPDKIYAGAKLVIPGKQDVFSPASTKPQTPAKAPQGNTAAPGRNPPAPSTPSAPQPPARRSGDGFEAPQTAPGTTPRQTQAPTSQSPSTRNTGGLSLGNGLKVDTKNPILQRMATGELRNGKDGYCTRTVRENMGRLGLQLPYGSTGADKNNPRGALVQTLKSGKWESVPTPGSQLRTIKSPFGTVQAQVISAKEYQAMVKEGRVPSGALVFQTKHGWDANVRDSKGNDVAIALNGGRQVHNYKRMGGALYGASLKEVVIMVPKGALQREQSQTQAPQQTPGGADRRGNSNPVARPDGQVPTQSQAPTSRTQSTPGTTAPNGYKSIDPRDFLAPEKGTNSPAAIIIGNAEGTRTPNGGTTKAFASHSDPGNRKLNMGSFSYQDGKVSNAAEADQAQLRALSGFLPAYKKAALAAGLDPNNALLVAGAFDSFNQGQAAGARFLKQMPYLKERGVTRESVIEARVRTWYDPSTNERYLNSKGQKVGGGLEKTARDRAAKAGRPFRGEEDVRITVRQDQTRRIDEMIKAMKAQGLAPRN